MSRQAGFSLVEMLTVVALIGILAGLVVASLLQARKVARDRRRVSDIRLIHSALQAYRVEQGSPPTNLADLVPDYLPSVPTDPLGGSYTYLYRATPPPIPACPLGFYVLFATLETTGVTDARNDQSCWSGNSDQIFVVTGH